MRVARVTLPGYNAYTDTNLDHFALYSDTDNVLIKRFTQGESVINASSSITIAHNLGYVPFFMVFVDALDNSQYSVVNNQWGSFSVPAQTCASDTNNLYIFNNDGAAHSFFYDIFYDDMSQTGTPIITESENVFKIARPGKAATSKNPNDFIMHSDLNNFKILKQGKATSQTIASGATITIAHGTSIDNPTRYFVFAKASDGKSYLLGQSLQYNYSETFLLNTYADATNIYVKNWSGSSVTVDIAYIIYGTGQDSSIPDPTTPMIAVAKAGKNVLGFPFTSGIHQSNPDDFNFHSYYNTLKYATSGTYSMTVTTTTVQTIAHNLGYTPFIIGFVNDFVGIIGVNTYAIMPYYFGNSNLAHPSRDIGAFIYADATNIYLKAWYQPNAVGTSKTFNFYYKIFKNNLGV